MFDVGYEARVASGSRCPLIGWDKLQKTIYDLEN